MNVAHYMLDSSNVGGSCCINYQAQEHTSLDILNECYARGEIDFVDYQSRRQDLEGK